MEHLYNHNPIGSIGLYIVMEGGPLFFVGALQYGPHRLDLIEERGLI